MGQCYYVKDAGAEAVPVVVQFRSETWMDPDEAGQRLAERHHLNTTCGVWCYERDLFDKADLRERLERVVDHVCSLDFEPETEALGVEIRERVAEQEQRGRRGRSRRSGRLSPEQIIRFMIESRGFAAEQIAEHTGVDVVGILEGRVRIDAGIALRLSAALGNDPIGWIWAQASVDLIEAKARVGELPPPMKSPPPRSG